MNCLVSGISQEAKEVVYTALNTAFGEGVIDIVELSESNLRQRVRLATKGSGSVETVLIILGFESFSLCKDWENDLKSDQRFHLYEDQSHLVDFLNSKFELEMEWEDEEVEENCNDTEVEELEKKYQLIVSAHQNREASLMAQIKELEERLLEDDFQENVTPDNSGELESLREQVTNLQADCLSVKNERDACLNELENLKKVQNTTSSSLKQVSGELSDFKVKYSTQTGVINSKDREIENLKQKIEELSSKIVKAELSETSENAFKEELTNTKKDLANKDKELKSLQVEYKQLEKKKVALEDSLDKLKVTLDIAEKENKETVESLKNRISELQSHEGQIDALNREIEEVQEINRNLSNELTSCKGKIDDCESTIVDLNKENLNLQGKLEILEKSTSRDTDVESIVTELTTLKSSYDSLSKNVYNRLVNHSRPISQVNINLLKNMSEHYTNINVVYAGSTESRKGMYKCLFNKCSKIDDLTETIIVDVVAETFIDYVFEIKSLRAGAPWFEKFDDISKYLSGTCLKNTKVLSFGGTKYVNDLYFLSINWDRVLQELQRLRLNIIIVCGDISNAIGRILHESLSNSVQSSSVYVNGNAISSRAIITNMKGISNISKSTVYYFELNTQVQKYVDIVKKTCKTQVLEG